MSWIRGSFNFSCIYTCINETFVLHYPKKHLAVMVICSSPGVYHAVGAIPKMCSIFDLCTAVFVA